MIGRVTSWEGGRCRTPLRDGCILLYMGNDATPALCATCGESRETRTYCYEVKRLFFYVHLSS